MAVFRFDLQRLLEHRERLERDKQLALAALERERLALEGRIREHQRAITLTKSDLRAALTGEKLGLASATEDDDSMVNARAVRLQAGASLRLVAKTQQLVLGLAGLHKRIGAARLELLDAATKRKAVELLKQRRYEAWKRAAAKREVNEMDEMATMRAGMRDGVFAGLPSPGGEGDPTTEIEKEGVE